MSGRPSPSTSPRGQPEHLVGAGIEISRGAEGAVADAQQHRHREVGVVVECEVELAVEIEVVSRDPVRLPPHREGDVAAGKCCLTPQGALVQQYRHAAVGDLAVEGGDDVGPPIAVEVANYHPIRIVADGVIDAQEATIRLAIEHRHGGGVTIGDNNIEPRAAVNVARGHALWAGTDRIVGGGAEAAADLAQEHRHRIGGAVAGDDVEQPIAVQVRQRQFLRAGAAAGTVIGADQVLARGGRDGGRVGRRARAGRSARRRARRRAGPGGCQRRAEDRRVRRRVQAACGIGDLGDTADGDPVRPDGGSADIKVCRCQVWPGVPAISRRVVDPGRAGGGFRPNLARRRTRAAR